MSDKKWTKKQLQSIYSRGGTVLVSAAAGSGKTSVLVERVTQMITDKEHPIDVDRLLVVTFTKAAAQEMKGRISKAISKLIRKNPEDLRLQRQRILLPHAHVSTVHSFCTNLIKENFEELGISPEIKVGEESYIVILKNEALEETVEEMYRKANRETSHPFNKLSFFLGGDRGDIQLYKRILRIHNFVQSHPFPSKWMDEKLEYYNDKNPPEKSVWGEILVGLLVDDLKGIISLNSSLVELIRQDHIISDKFMPMFMEYEKNFLSAFNELTADEFDWDKSAISVKGLSNIFGRMSKPRGDEFDKELYENVKEIRSIIIKETRKLAEVITSTKEQYYSDLDSLYPVIKVLFDTVKLFDKKFSEKKRENGVLDYSDLEHFAIKLLLNENGEKTVFAKELSEQFEEVLVDEYQDTNFAQEAIFKAVSKNETNLFIVGDVKQSIYMFRNAAPSIFINRRSRYPEFDGENYPATITLGDNFRSRKEVTDSVNFVFSQLMYKSVAGIDYDENEKLFPKAEYEDGKGYETEFIMIDDSFRDKEEEKNRVEAKVIANRIKNIVGKLDVTVEGETRKADYGDICILLRSKSNHDKDYVKELLKEDIPAWSASTSGFFEAPEIGVAISLLKVIDNPINDIALLSVLMSPVFRFLPDDIAEIRLSDKEANIYTTLRRYEKNGGNEGLKEKTKNVFKNLSNWRISAVTLPADQLIHKVFEDCGIISIYSAMKNGEQRRANLRLLHEKARGFEQNGFRGLSAFIRYVNYLREQDVDFAPASVSGQVNVVTILTIHGSKGLEFPVVFLAGLGREFNKIDLRDNLLIEPNLGVGIKMRDMEKMLEWDTIPRTAINKQLEKNMLSEELRVLYVAMTRAREKLIMVMSEGAVDRKISEAVLQLSSSVEDEIPVSLFYSAKGLGDWILASLIRHPDAKELRDRTGINIPVLSTSNKPIKISVVEETEEKKEEEEKKKLDIKPDKTLMTEIKSKLSYSYPYEHITKLQQKMGASEYAAQKTGDSYVAVSRPAFLSESGLTAAERGTALHTFMQFADYDNAKENVAGEIKRLEDFGFLSTEQSSAIEINRVNRFFNSDLYRRIEKAGKSGEGNLLREVDFFYEIPASEMLKAEDIDSNLFDKKDSIVIQGIADCVFSENGKINIVDYKTDFVRTEKELLDRYEEQMRIYAKALRFALEMSVGQCVLYSFELDKVVDVSYVIEK